MTAEFQHFQVQCPSLHTGIIALPVQLDVFSEPFDHALVEDPDFDSWYCPHCQCRYPVSTKLSYADLVRRHFILVYPRRDVGYWQEIEARMPAVLQAAAQPYVSRTPAGRDIVRLVFGMSALREKLLLWDAGLDDRIIEIAKRRFIQRLKAQHSHYAACQFETHAVSAIERKILLNAYRLPSQEHVGRGFLDFDYYHGLKHQDPFLQEQYRSLFTSPFVHALRLISQDS